jgi:hypothetical protein
MFLMSLIQELQHHPKTGLASNASPHAMSHNDVCVHFIESNPYIADRGLLTFETTGCADGCTRPRIQLQTVFDNENSSLTMRSPCFSPTNVKAGHSNLQIMNTPPLFALARRVEPLLHVRASNTNSRSAAGSPAMSGARQIADTHSLFFFSAFFAGALPCAKLAHHTTQPLFPTFQGIPELFSTFKGGYAVRCTTHCYFEPFLPPVLFLAGVVLVLPHTCSLQSYSYI